MKYKYSFLYESGSKVSQEFLMDVVLQALSGRCESLMAAVILRFSHL